MRLVNPGAGEMADRLTILALKILHGESADKDVKHFQHEQATLLTQFRARSLNGGWIGQLLDLAAVNGALWHAEDLLRQYREIGRSSANQEEIVELAFRIQELNDQRSALVQRINMQAGEHLGMEKV